MGALYVFSCEDCGYEAEVSGGQDIGFIAVTQTMVCNKCQELVDIVVGHQGKEGPSGDPELNGRMGRCPNCHRCDLKVWKDGGACPKCGGTMVRTDGPTVMWD